MAKRKKKLDEREEADQILGHDPFEDVDLTWMDREEGELSIKALGHDPLQDMDVGWIDQEQEERAPDMAQEESQVVLEDTETGGVVGMSSIRSIESETISFIE